VSTGEPAAHPLHLSAGAAPHPEEMRATFELTVGRSVSLRATARATPAGLAGAAGFAAAVLVPAIWIVRGWKRGRQG
jgi:hypothetical protein